MKFRQKTISSSRRQRTSTDQSTSSFQNFAYNSSRQTGQNQQAGRQPLQERPNLPSAKAVGRFWWQRLGLLIFLVAATASLLNILSLSSSAQIILLNQTSGKLYFQPTAVYQAAADQVLKSSIWNHNKITVNANAVSDQLKRKFPELTSVSITMPLLTHRPLIYLQAAQPALVLNAANGSFVIGTSGKALVHLAAAEQPPSNIPNLTDQSGLQPKVGQQVLPESYVKFVQIVVAELSAKQIEVSSLSLPPSSSELDVHLMGQAYYVKFNLQDNNPAGEAGTFLATINSLNKQSIKPSQYVDVRVPGRAYYL